MLRLCVCSTCSSRAWVSITNQIATWDNKKHHYNMNTRLIRAGKMAARVINFAFHISTLSTPSNRALDLIRNIRRIRFITFCILFTFILSVYIFRNIIHRTELSYAFCLLFHIRLVIVLLFSFVLHTGMNISHRILRATFLVSFHFLENTNIKNICLIFMVWCVCVCVCMFRVVCSVGVRMSYNEKRFFFLLHTSFDQ